MVLDQTVNEIIVYHVENGPKRRKQLAKERGNGGSLLSTVSYSAFNQDASFYENNDNNYLITAAAAAMASLICCTTI